MTEQVKQRAMMFAFAALPMLVVLAEAAPRIRY
jgi:hypothetical protein